MYLDKKSYLVEFRMMYLVVFDNLFRLLTIPR